MDRLHATLARTPPPTAAGPAGRLERELADALRSGRASSELHEAISNYAAETGRHGVPQHKMLAAAQALMRRASRDHALHSDTDALAERILSWLAEEYARRLRG
jgi:hypothetical protein